MTEAIKNFNKKLVEMGSQTLLSEDAEQIGQNYQCYIAKKKGVPKSDFPSLSLQSNVKRINYERFSLGCFTNAFVGPQAASAILSSAQQSNPNLSSMQAPASVAQDSGAQPTVNGSLLGQSDAQGDRPRIQEQVASTRGKEQQAAAASNRQLVKEP